MESLAQPWHFADCEEHVDVELLFLVLVLESICQQFSGFNLLNHRLYYFFLQLAQLFESLFELVFQLSYCSLSLCFLRCQLLFYSSQLVFGFQEVSDDGPGVKATF